MLDGWSSASIWRCEASSVNRDRVIWGLGGIFGRAIVLFSERMRI